MRAKLDFGCVQSVASKTYQAFVAHHSKQAIEIVRAYPCKAAQLGQISFANAFVGGVDIQQNGHDWQLKPMESPQLALYAAHKIDKIAAKEAIGFRCAHDLARRRRSDLKLK